jgi:hypothetical protein
VPLRSDAGQPPRHLRIPPEREHLTLAAKADPDLRGRLRLGLDGSDLIELPDGSKPKEFFCTVYIIPTS